MEDEANPFVHVELNTTDVDKAKKFYRQLFDWQMEDVAMGPSGRYAMIKPGTGTGGGILKHPMPGEPSFWLAYVGWRMSRPPRRRLNRWAPRLYGMSMTCRAPVG
jgi:predicted enzyme related to lactoylglutathione lyase